MQVQRTENKAEGKTAACKQAAASYGDATQAYEQEHYCGECDV